MLDTVATGFEPDQGNTGQAPSYLSRQPVLDRRGVVFGYELLFHQTPGPKFGPNHLDPLAAARHGLLDALAVFGVERFTGGARAFLECSVESLAEDAWDGLPPAHMVLQIASPAQPSAPLVRACRTLRESGFQIALARFDAARAGGELSGLADYVKVDADSFESPVWEGVCARLAGSRAVVIADRIHTHEAYCKARALGVKYFQGFYFCSPELIPSNTIPAHHTQQFRILHELFKDPLDLKSLSPLVMADASLVYRLLRFVNSPLCAVRETVTSVEAAILMLGDAQFRRIATLAIQCGLSQDQPAELLNMALVRARFCSAAASMCGLDPEEQYLIGMLSLLPPMLRVPMQTILPQLPLRDAVRDALAGRAGPERALLSWIEHIEENDVPRCEEIAAAFQLDRDQLIDTYWHAMNDLPMLAD